MPVVTLVNNKLMAIHMLVNGSGPSATRDISVLKFKADGSFDNTFGTSGRLTFLTGTTQFAFTLNVLTDGTMIIQGGQMSGSTPQLTLLAVGPSGNIATEMASGGASFTSGTCVMSFGNVYVTNGALVIIGGKQGSGGPSVPFGFRFTIAGVSAVEGGDGGSAPTLVTSSNAASLERAPGVQSMVVNGQEVEIDTTRVDTSGARTPPSQRTESQIRALQAAGRALLQAFVASLPAGSTTNVTVANTATGAVMRNLVFDANNNSIDVPVEDIVLLDGGTLSLMIGSNNANITSDGKYQVGVGGTVGVVGSGLGANAAGEIVAMSTPTLLGSFTANATGDVQKSAVLPSSIGVGDHTLVVATGSTFAIMGIRVVPASLPATGVTESSGRTLVIALFTLVFAAVLVRSRRLALLTR